MCKKASESSKSSNKGGIKKERAVSITYSLSAMDNRVPKSKYKPKFSTSSSYTDDLDLPPSSEDEEEITDVPSKATSRPTIDLNTIKLSKKEINKREKKEMMLEAAAELVKKEALKDDGDAFTVVIGSRSAALKDEAADANVKDITIENFSVSARGKELLKNACVKIAHGKRYGLVGPNGMGKSTLLKLLAWRKIPVPKNIDVLLVEQEIMADDSTALEAVVFANQELVKLREEVAALNERSDDEDGDKLAELYEKLQLMGSDAAESQASRILVGLGFTKEMQCRATKSFSGGWRMRISLARALFIQPTLLLLDEPTNHLDLKAVLWLEEYLCRWKNTLVVVSHDRDFLNTVCGQIIHLHDQKLHLYRGNFDEFESAYEQKRKEANKRYETHEKQLRMAHKSGNKELQDRVKEAAKFKAAKDSSKNGKGKDNRAVDHDEAPPKAPTKWKDYTVKFDFPQPTELTPPLLQLIEVGFGYHGREDFKLSNVDVGVDMGTRVAIVGPNGAGKSTLLNLLAGDLEPCEGEVRRSQKLKIGRYSQHFVDSLQMELDPVHYLFNLHPHLQGKHQIVRSKLGSFGLRGHNHLTPITKLSGGQKARVVFTSISMSQPHILLLDEPTNHLDMQSIDALAKALEVFSGGVVLVSHDSHLISQVCQDEEKSEIWVVEEGSVRRFPGTFEDYKDDLLREIRAQADD